MNYCRKHIFWHATVPSKSYHCLTSLRHVTNVLVVHEALGKGSNVPVVKPVKKSIDLGVLPVQIPTAFTDSLLLLCPLLLDLLRSNN